MSTNKQQPESKDTKIFVFSECKNYGENEFEGYLIYCVYKEDWIKFQHDNDNYTEDDKLEFQKGAITGKKLREYQLKAKSKIEGYTTEVIEKEVQPIIDDYKTKLDKSYQEQVEKYKNNKRDELKKHILEKRCQLQELKKKVLEQKCNKKKIRQQNLKKWKNTFWGLVCVNVTVTFMVIGIIMLLKEWILPFLMMLASNYHI